MTTQGKDTLVIGDVFHNQKSRGGHSGADFEDTRMHLNLPLYEKNV
jgi:hypothetical protein